MSLLELRSACSLGDISFAHSIIYFFAIKKDTNTNKK